MELNERNRAKLGEEFPWLLAILPFIAEELIFKRIGLDILTKFNYGWWNFGKRYVPVDRLLMIDADGGIVAEVGGWKTIDSQRIWFVRKFPFLGWASCKRQVGVRETVAQALERLPRQLAEKVRYIIDLPGEVSHANRTVIVYRLPNQADNLIVWLNALAHDGARKQLGALAA